MTFSEKFLLIKRMDYLIKSRSTGSPENFMSKLNVSKPTFYRLIETICNLGNEISYSRESQTYFYLDSDFDLFGQQRQK